METDFSRQSERLFETGDHGAIRRPGIRLPDRETRSVRKAVVLVLTIIGLLILLLAILPAMGLRSEAMTAFAKPIDLVSFEARMEGTSAQLEWITASESDNHGFFLDVEAGGDWNELAWVSGAGTTDRTTTYLFDVHGLPTGDVRFRLRQLDSDGMTDFSTVLRQTVELESGIRLYEPVRNPYYPSTVVRFAVGESQRVQVDVVDAAGTVRLEVFDDVVPAQTTVDRVIMDSSLASGDYQIRMIGVDGTTKTWKLDH